MLPAAPVTATRTGSLMAHLRVGMSGAWTGRRVAPILPLRRAPRYVLEVTTNALARRALYPVTTGRTSVDSQATAWGLHGARVERGRFLSP